MEQTALRSLRVSAGLDASGYTQGANEIARAQLHDIGCGPVAVTQGLTHFGVVHSV